MKRLKYGQKRGLEHLGVSRYTANLLAVGGSTVLVVFSGAWFVSHLQREVFNQSEDMRRIISGGHNPKETASQKPASEKQS